MVQWRHHCLSIVIFIITQGPALICPAQATAQYTITGSVIDSSGHPVADASVSVIERATESAFFFSRTNKSGNFSFVLDDSLKEDLLAVRVNAIGYEKLIVPLSDRKKNIVCVLKPAVNTLPDITVIHIEPAIKIKGDTLSYLASAFSSKADRVLNDVLKKIPGIEIDENNTIKYLGKPINHLYIDGDDLFDNKYQSATTVIPYEIVNRIEVIPDNQHIKMLNGIVPAYLPGINVTIKDKHRLNVINSLQLGAGTPSVTDNTFDNLSFKPKLKFVNIARYSNSGNDIINSSGIQDINDLSTNSENTGVSSLLTPSAGMIPGIEKRRYFNNHTAEVGLNDFIKTKKEISWKLNAYYITETQNQAFDNNTRYVLPNDTISYVQTQAVHTNRKIFRAALHTNLNTKKRFFTNVFTIDRNDISGNSEINQESRNVSQLITNLPQRYSNAFSTILLLPKKRFLEISSIVSYEPKKQSQFVTPGIQKEILTQNRDYFSATQSIELPVFFSNNFISYKATKGTLFQNYTAGIVTQAAELLSSISVEPISGPVPSPDSAFQNNLNWHKTKLYAEARFIIRKKNVLVNIALPVSRNYIQYESRIDGQQVKIDKMLLTPDARLDYRFGVENLAYAGFRYNRHLGNMNELYRGIIMKDFQTFASNGFLLQETEARTLTFGLNLKKPLKLWSADLSGAYWERKMPFIRSALINNRVLKTVAVQMPNTAYSSTYSLHLSKNVPAIKSNFSAGYSLQYSRAYELQNNFLFPINTLAHYLSAKINFTPVDVVSVSIASRQSWLRIKQMQDAGLKEKQFKTGQSRNTLEVNFFPAKNISAKINIDQVGFTNQNTQASNAIMFIDAALRYTIPRSGIFFDLSSTNISNQQNYTDLYAVGNITSVSNYALRPHMLLFSVAMTF